MTPANHLVVFARRPRIGRVKTRLARDIGTVAAWAFYRRTLERTVRPLARDGRWRCWLAVTPEAAVAGGGLATGGCRIIGQGAGNLGRRMARVAQGLPPGPVVIVGADVPDLRPRHVAQAFKALGEDDFVFGPAPDGGYWLVGLGRRRGHGSIFGNVRWSSEHALADTIANIAGGRTLALLEVLEDIDDGDAYRRWMEGPGKD